MDKRARGTDADIGHRVRLQRRSKGMSQTELANACGVTFQQVQKYEKGANRVSGSRLQQIADALGVTPAAFFGDEGAGKDRAIGGELTELLTIPGALRLVSNYAKLTPGQRAALLQVTDDMMEECGPAVGRSPRGGTKRGPRGTTSG